MRREESCGRRKGGRGYESCEMREEKRCERRRVVRRRKFAKEKNCERKKVGGGGELCGEEILRSRKVGKGRELGEEEKLEKEESRKK
jgi:hypothetical protein